MPQAVVAVISAVATVGFTTAAAAGISITAMATATAFAIGAGVIAVGALAASKLMSSLYEMPKMDTDASRQRTVRSTIEPQKIIYGEALVSGPIAFVGVYGSKNRVLAHAVALAGHEVNAITDIHFDNEVIDNSLIDGNGFVTSGTFGPVGNNQFNDQGGVNFGFNICKINKHLGAAGQTVDADLDSAFGSIDSSHKGTGIAYITTHWLLKDDSQEIWDKYTPTNIKALVQGRKVYDPRTELTAYSDNPALCVADYLTNTEFGMGISSSRIDWNSVANAANSCDVLVDTPDGTDSQKRFTCNGVLFATDTHKTNINKLLSSMNGLLTYTNGTFVIRAGVYEAPTVSLNENDLIGGVSVKTSVERSDRFNTITGTFIDPTQNHKATEFPEVFTTAARDRDNGNVLTKNIQLPMTNDRYMAQRIAHKLVQQSDQQKVVTFPTNLSGMDVAVGDRVEISLSEFGWVDKVFICLGWTLNDSGNGGINLILREDDAGSYADPAVGEYSTITATGQIVEGFRGVPDPQNLIATSFNNYIQLNWNNPDNMNDVLFIEVFASPVSAWSETFTATSGQTVFVYDRDFTVDDTFDVKLDGVALVQGTDFTVDLETKTLTLTTGATAGDILEIFNRIKIGETDGTQFVHDAATPADSISPDDTRYYWIRARAYSTGETALSVSDRNPDNDVSTVFATVGRVDFLNVSGDVVQTGDTSRTLVDRLSDIISPDDFGAVGDGIEDDTAALKALAAWIYSISTDLDTGYRKGHVSIRFPARRLYKITDTIDFGGEAKDDGSGAVQTGLRVHFDFNNCEIAPAPHPDTGVVSSALRMWGDNSSWKNLKVNYARYCTKDQVYADQPTGVYVGPDPADMSTRFASNSFATYENIQVFDAYNGFELEPDTIALFKVTWRQCDAKGCMNWGFLMDSQPIIGASTTNTFQQCHVAAKLASDTSRVYIDEPSTATSGQTVISYTQDFTNVDEPIVKINSTYLDRSIFAQYLIVGETYIIINLGDSDWNTIAGTTGVTYSIGDVITVAVAGTAGSTGRAGDYTVDRDPITLALTGTITLAVGLTAGDEIHVYGVYDPIQTHVPDSTNKAGYGANWTDYWFRLNNADTVSSVRELWDDTKSRYYEDGKGWYLYGFGSTGFIGQCAIDGTNNRVAGNAITCLQFGLTISGGFHWEVAKFVSDGIPSILVQNASLHIDHLYMPEPYFVNDGVNTVIGGSNSRLCHVEEVRVIAANMSRGTRALIDASGFGVVHAGIGIAEDEVVNSPSSNVHGAYDVERKITARSMFRELGQDFGGLNSTVTPATWQSGTTFVHNTSSAGSFTLNLTKDPERGSEYRAFCYYSAGGATANVTASSTDGATIIGPTVAKGGETLVAYKTGNSFWHTRIEYTQNFGSGDPSVGDVKPADLTVAELPSASTYEGYVIRVTDDSSYGEVLVYSDGSNWLRVNDLNPADSTGVTYVDTANGRLGVNNNAPANQLSVGAIENSSGDQLGTVGIKSDANDKAIMIQEASGQEQWELGVDVDGDLNFYNSGSATPSVQFLDAGGVDVTGTVTADGLTVDGTAGATQLNILNDTATTVEASWTHADVSGTSVINVGRNSTWGGELIIQTDTKNRANFASNGDISFYEDTGTTAKFFWDASTENLGIGTTVPIADIEINANTSDSAVMIRSSDTGTSNLYLGDQSGAFRGGLKYDNSADSLGIYANGLATADITINSSGNVGIGTTNPATALDVAGTVTADGLTVTTGSASGTLATLKGSTGFGFTLASSATAPYIQTIGVGGGEEVAIESGGTKLALFQDGGDISFYEDTGTTAKLTWSASGETLNFADNAKAVFGAGSDLIIEHNGSFSRIQENGTGPLYIQATDLLLTDSGGVDTYATFSANGAATLRYDNAQKLATTSTGINVTGTVTATAFSGSDSLGFYDYTTDARIQLGANGGGASGVFGSRRISDAGALRYGTYWAYDCYWDDTNQSWYANRTTLSNKTVIEQNYHQGAAFKFRYYGGDASSGWADSAWNDLVSISTSGRVGIGTSSPSNELHISSSSSTKALFERTGSTGSYIGLKDSSGSLAYLGVNNGTFEVQTAGSSYATKLAITSTGSVGIGTSSPSTALEVAGVIRASDGTEYTEVKDYGIDINRSNAYLRPTSAFNGTANLNIGGAGNIWNIVSIESDNSFQITDGTDKRFEVQAGADAIFYDNVGVEGMRWDSSAQRLGIGVSAPSAKLDISAVLYSINQNGGIRIGDTGGNWNAGVKVKSDGSGNPRLAFEGTSGNEELSIASGKIGIRTSVPNDTLQINGDLSVAASDGAYTASYYAKLKSQYGPNPLALESRLGDVIQASNYGSELTFLTGSASTVERLKITNSGNVGIATSSPTEKLDVNGTVKATAFSGSGASLTNVNAATLDSLDSTQFLRSDTSDTMNGNLTVTNDLTAGESFFGATSYKVRINSTSSTGILEFNSTNGVIRNTGTVLGLAANSTQIVDVRAGSMQPTTDNATDLGASTKRWDNIYATNALIQTSDGAEKQDVEALSDAELRVAQSIKGLIRKFRFKSAVAEKGDDARIHFGVIAQDVRAAFEAEGLDATQYGCFCADVDEDGNERLGIRYDELLAFVITAL